MTFIDKFDYLNKKYAKKADSAKLTDKFIAVQITLTDEDCGGTLYSTYINGALAFEPYDYHDNTVAIKISSKLLEDILKNKADAEKEFKAGNIEAYGNLGHALQMLNALKETAPAKKAKAPKSKKPAEKKAEVKAEAPKKTEKKTEVKTEAPKKTEMKAEVKAAAPKAEIKKAEVKAAAPKAEVKKAEVKAAAPKAEVKKAEVKAAAPKKAEKAAPEKTEVKKNNVPKK